VTASVSPSRQPPPSGQGFGDRPYETQVTSVNTENDQCVVDSIAGPDTVQVPHPMLSTNAWIRAQPERGARLMVMGTAGSSMRRAPLGYYSRSAAELIKRYRAGTGLYRPLEAGEFELMTPGLAVVAGAADGVLSLRGGVVRGELDPKRMRARWRAPTHVRELHQHDEDTIGDEERFGVVVRNLTNDKRNRWLRPPGATGEDAGFAKEYLRVYGRPSGRLALYQEGDIFDDAGQPTQAWTGKNVRAVRELYDGSGTVVLQHEVDVAGSFRLRGIGSQIDVSEQAADTTVALKQLQVTLAQLLGMQAGTAATIEAATTATFAGNVSTELGPGPVREPVIKGTAFLGTVMVPFLTALSAHFQAASLPPPAGPLDFLSYKPIMAAVAEALRAFIGACNATLSLNVKTT
jgi:hypothetical protein